MASQRTKHLERKERGVLAPDVGPLAQQVGDFRPFGAMTDSSFHHIFPETRIDKRSGRPYIVEKYKTMCTNATFRTVMTADGPKQVQISCNHCSHCHWVKRQTMANSVMAEKEASDWAFFLTLTVRPGAKVAFNAKGEMCGINDFDEVAHVVDLAKEFCPPVMQRFQKTVRNRRVRSLLTPLPGVTGNDPPRRRRRREPGSFERLDYAQNPASGVWELSPESAAGGEVEPLAVTSWRYVQVAERGEKNGRAHYHMIVCGKGEKPAFTRFVDEFRRGNSAKNKTRFLMPEWPHGFCHVAEVRDIKAAWYLSKYSFKSFDSWSSRSSQYAIGGEYIRERGRRLARIAGSPTTDWKFGMGLRGFTKQGIRLRYKAMMTGAKRRYLFEAFDDEKVVMALESGLLDAAALAGDAGFLSRLRVLPRAVRTNMVPFEVRRRRRQFKAEKGRYPIKRTDPDYCGIDEDGPIKQSVWNEYQRALDLPVTDLQGRVILPPDPVFKGWGRTQAGRDFIKKSSTGPPVSRADKLDPPPYVAVDPRLEPLADAFQALVNGWIDCDCEHCSASNRAGSARFEAIQAALNAQQVAGFGAVGEVPGVTAQEYLDARRLAAQWQESRETEARIRRMSARYAGHDERRDDGVPHPQQAEIIERFNAMQQALLAHRIASGEPLSPDDPSLRGHSPALLNGGLKT